MDARLYSPTQLDAGVVSLLADAIAVRILTQLVAGAQRYSAFKLGVSSKTLSARLKRLEQEGLISRTLHAQVPPKVEYALTQKGSELLSILEGISSWERSWVGSN